MYIPLHWHSTYSFLEAIWKPKDIVKKAKQLWLPAIWLTDIDVMYWAIQFYQAAKDEEINPIIWVEIGFTLDINNITNLKSVGSLCLIATSEEGYLNLMKIVSYASQDGFKGRPTMDLHILEECKEWLIWFCWWIDSWIFKLLSASESLSRIEEIVVMIKDILCEGNFYFEMIAQDEKVHWNIAQINKTILSLSEKMKIPCIVNNIYLYPNSDDKTTQELAMAIKDNVKIYDPQHRVTSTKSYIMLEDEIVGICKNNWYSEDLIKTWVDNTQIIADRCDVFIRMKQLLFPKYAVEEDVLEVYEQHKDDLIIED